MWKKHINTALFESKDNQPCGERISQATTARSYQHQSTTVSDFYLSFIPAYYMHFQEEFTTVKNKTERETMKKDSD